MHQRLERKVYNHCDIFIWSLAFMTLCAQLLTEKERESRGREIERQRERQERGRERGRERERGVQRE